MTVRTMMKLVGGGLASSVLLLACQTQSPPQSPHDSSEPGTQAGLSPGAVEVESTPGKKTGSEKNKITVYVVEAKGGG